VGAAGKQQHADNDQPSPEHPYPSSISAMHHVIRAALVMVPCHG
jgi:hypothetical protein